MKKITLLTLITTLFLLINLNKTNAQSLSAGDIAFVGMNTDATEGYAFITLTEIPSSEKIFFSDRGIVNTISYIAGTEGTYLFTAPASGIPCGTIVSIRETSPDTYTVTGITGASMTLQAGSANLGSGDQVYAYQTATNIISTAPSDATFIAGIMCDYDVACIDASTKWTQEACVSSTSESVVPPGLTNGVNCISMTPTGPEIDNMRYTGSLTGNASALRPLINNPANWETNNSPAYNFTPSDFSSASVDCTVLSVDSFSSKNNISLYPNPTTNFIQITELKNKSEYSIISSLGKVVKKGVLNNNDRINIKSLNNGIYILKFSNGTSIKFIKN